MCDSKITEPIIGFKAAGTGIPLIKKFKEKEPFYASVYKRNFLKNGQRVKVNKSTLGIELEVCYKIKKSFFNSKGLIIKKDITKYISHMAPCIEVVGYRQRKKGITSFGDLCSDFGANVKFIIGQSKKFKKINIGNLKTKIMNKKISYSIDGNTKSVYINPLNSLRFVLRKLKHADDRNIEQLKMIEMISNKFSFDIDVINNVLKKLEKNFYIKNDRGKYIYLA